MRNAQELTLANGWRQAASDYPNKFMAFFRPAISQPR